MIEEEEKKCTLLQLNAKENISQALFFFGRLLNRQTFFCNIWSCIQFAKAGVYFSPLILTNVHKWFLKVQKFNGPHSHFLFPNVNVTLCEYKRLTFRGK